MVDIVVVGNCQATQIATALGILSPEIQPVALHLMDPAALEIDPGKLIFLQSTCTNLFDRYPNAITFPSIAFSGFHPDAVRLETRGVRSGFKSHWHSAIVLAAFHAGRTVQQTLSLFNEDVFDAAGYFDQWHMGKEWLMPRLAECHVDVTPAFLDWCADGSFMHYPNHPMQRVHGDLAIAMARHAGLAIRDVHPERYMVDRMLMVGAWPVYPEIAARLGLEGGEYYFRKHSSFDGGGVPLPLTDTVDLVGLEDFVARSFATYRRVDASLLACGRLADGTFVSTVEKAMPASTARRSPRAGNPYADLPDNRFWRRAVSSYAAAEVDPVGEPKFSIAPSDRIATGGSCFAQHISAELVKRGAGYMITERAPEGLTQQEAIARNYGVYSARFGNLYTVRQVVQLFDRAFGYFDPDEPAWIRADGRFADPFRPQIEPEGFASVDTLLADRRQHLDAVRQMFSDLDVFVFTLGLTEAWRSKATGAVYPIAPGVSAGAMDSGRHEFVNFNVVEVTRDLRRLYERLKAVNRGSRLLLTVSPVPLVATYEPRHVLTSTTASKAVLRAAAQEAAKLEDVDYFPSFEIITGSFNRGAYFNENFREVRPEGVAHVMRVFGRHYLDCVAEEDSRLNRAREADARMHQDMEDVSNIVCEEELLDAG